jgi:hypothetical protein
MIGVDPGAVREARVDVRRGLVDPPSDLTRRSSRSSGAGARRRGSGWRLVDLPVALDVDVVGAVAHHLGDGDVGEQRLDRTEAEDVVDRLDDQPLRSAAESGVCSCWRTSPSFSRTRDSICSGVTSVS